jgi:hypothetical protein
VVEEVTVVLLMAPMVLPVIVAAGAGALVVMLVMAVLVLVHVMELAALEMQQMRLVAVVVEEEGLRRRTMLVVLAPVAAAWVFWVKDQTGLRLTIISVPVALEVREVETVIVMTDQVTVVDMAGVAGVLVMVTLLKTDIVLVLEQGALLELFGVVVERSRQLTPLM